MTKDSVLYSIIGVLLGFIFGFFFANTFNERGAPTRAGASSTTTATAVSKNSALPENHPVVPSNGVADGQAMQANVQATIQDARDQPDNFGAQLKAAQLYYQIRRYDQAIEFLLRANKIRPNDFETTAALGNSYVNSNRFEEAEKWYTIALTKNPDNADVRTYLGLTFSSRTPPDYDRAIKEFRRALEQDPQNEAALEALAVALIAKKDAKEAEATIEKLEKVNASNEGLSKLRNDLEALRSSK